MHPPECTRRARLNSVPASSGESEEWRRPCLIDELCSECSESSSTSDATTARWYEAFQRRAAESQPTFRKARRLSPNEGIQTFGRRPDARKRKSPLSSFCRSAGRRCFAGHSMDVRDARGSPVGRKNERVRSQMTGQSMVDAVTGDHSTDNHLGLLVFLDGRFVQL